MEKLKPIQTRGGTVLCACCSLEAMGVISALLIGWRGRCKRNGRCSPLLGRVNDSEVARLRRNYVTESLHISQIVGNTSTISTSRAKGRVSRSNILSHALGVKVH